MSEVWTTGSCDGCGADEVEVASLPAKNGLRAADLCHFCIETQLGNAAIYPAHVYGNHDLVPAQVIVRSLHVLAKANGWRLRSEAFAPTNHALGICVGCGTSDVDTVATSVAGGRRIVALCAFCAAMVRRDVCDACAGTGKPISGLPCMCGGSGRMSDAVPYLRTRILDLEEKLRKAGLEP